jgi:hypothetical protein
MEELERTPAPRPNPHRRPAAGARAGDAAVRRGVRLRGGGRALFPGCIRMKVFWALSVTRPVGPLWGPNALDGATTFSPGSFSRLLSPGPDGPSPAGRCRPSNTFSPSSAQETRNADVMLTLAAL